jgi:hypothetical protein
MDIMNLYAYAQWTISVIRLEESVPTYQTPICTVNVREPKKKEVFGDLNGQWLIQMAPKLGIP